MAVPTGPYQGQDLINFNLGNKFLPRDYYSLNPYKAPLPTSETETVTQGFGIPYTNAFTGGDNARPSFNYESSRNYQPGGMYERNPQASGALNTVMNAQGQIVPNTRFGAGTHLNDPNLDPGDYKPNIMPGRSQFSPLELSYMSSLPESGQNLSRMEKLQMMARNFKGVNSAYEKYRTTGKLGEYAKTGIGTIPFLTRGATALANTLGLQMTGDKSDRQRWAVDNAGFGQGTGRDQFGVYTGGKTLMGDTANYKQRMENEVNKLEAFFAAGKKNSTKEAQLKDYKIKLGILDENDAVAQATLDTRNRRSAKNIRIMKQRGIKYGPTGTDIHGPDTPKDTPPRHPPSTWTPAGGNGGGTGSPDGGAQAAGDLAGGSALDSPFAEGGRIGYRNGEFVDENINVEGPNFDVNENVEMAEGPSPFEMTIEELMDEGMSWEEAYNIASQEFSSVEGPEDSFSQEGIASIV